MARRAVGDNKARRASSFSLTPSVLISMVATLKYVVTRDDEEDREGGSESDDDGNDVVQRKRMRRNNKNAEADKDHGAAMEARYACMHNNRLLIKCC